MNPCGTERVWVNLSVAERIWVRQLLALELSESERGWVNLSEAVWIWARLHDSCCHWITVRGFAWTWVSLNESEGDHIIIHHLCNFGWIQFGQQLPQVVQGFPTNPAQSPIQLELVLIGSLCHIIVSNQLSDLQDVELNRAKDIAILRIMIIELIPFTH